MASAPSRIVGELSKSYPVQEGASLAFEQIRRMRGGSQSHLMRCSDGYYVVKFPGNPQGTRILANEILGGRLAKLLGLPVAEGRIIHVPEDLVRLTDDLVFELPREKTRCPAGLCFGSRYQGDPRNSSSTLNFIAGNPVNKRDLLGMLVFDKWTCNTDGRQVVYCHVQEDGQFSIDRTYRAVMVDQGFCFNATEWDFPDAPLRGRFYRTSVYDDVTGINCFEPWLTMIETKIDAAAIFKCAEGIPEEWYGASNHLVSLLEKLDRRRLKVRELLLQMARATPVTFANWVCRDIEENPYHFQH
jgi:hypothetical protein